MVIEIAMYHGVCGARPTAENDEELVQKVLEHAREVHPEMGLTEEKAREMVAEGASDRPA